MPVVARRNALGAAGFAVGAVVVHHVLYALTKHQWPRIFHDSETFTQIAAQPLAFDHLFYPKPFFTPAFDRLAGTPGAIIKAQVELSFWSWVALAAVLVGVTRSLAARVVGPLACAAFLLAPLRVGFTATVLSESVDDSLRVLVVALAIALVTVAAQAGRRRTLACSAIAGVLVVATTALVLTRDTDALVVLAAAVIAAWRGAAWRWWPRERWALATVAAIAVVAVFAIESSRIVPAQPLGLSLTEGWAPEYDRARGNFALVDDFMFRVMSDPVARARAIDDGMPWSPELEPFAGKYADDRFLSAPQYAATRQWLFAHGASTYVGWLARHPLARVDEVVANAWYLLAPPDWTGWYMPRGWRADNYGGLVMRTFRSLTECPAIILVLAIAAPLAWRRARSHRLAPAIVCIVASAVIGVFAGYYGDAMEIARHAWGAGQQLILGLVLVIVARLDTRDTAVTEPRTR